MRTSVFAATAVLCLSALPVAAEPAKSLGKFGAWEAFAYSEKAGKVCYAASIASRSTGGDKGRLPVVTVTHRPADKTTDTVSVTGGYAYKKDSAVLLDVGGQRFDLFTSGDTAWATDAAGDKAMVKAFAKGKDVVVKGSGAKAGDTTDSFSLQGFGPAYAEIGKACGVK